MKMFKFFSILILIFLASSCTTLKTKFLGVHQPRQETKEYIMQFVKSKKIDTTQIYLVKEDWIFKSLFENLNYAILFDSQGNEIDFNSVASNSTCGGNILSTLEMLPNEKSFPRNYERTFNKEIQNWITKEGDSVNENVRDPKCDYVLVYYWNTFSGRPNHTGQISEMRKRIESNSKVKVQTFLINQDLRVGMNMEELLVKYKESQAALEEKK